MEPAVILNSHGLDIKLHRLNDRKKKCSKFPFEILLPRRRDTLKTYIEQNIAAASEFPQQAGKAKDFQDFSRMQMDAMKRFYEPDLNRSR